MMSENYKMLAKGFQFKSLKEIRTFLNMSDTAQANMYVNDMKDDIVIIGKEQETFYYDTDSKLWLCCTREKYSAYIPDFCEQSRINLKAAFLKYTEDIDDDDKKSLLKKVEKQMDKFDKAGYHTSILTRSTGKLQNNKFVTKLNAIPHLFPIKNGKKINLKTLEITDREKTDYFTFESNVDYVKETPNADKFFKQVFTSKDVRTYAQKTLGYTLTGDTSAQIFVICIGRGRNGKTVTANLLKEIMTDTYYTQCDKSIFVKTQKSTGASPEKVALIGKRIAVYSEGETADNYDFDWSSIKEITGEDEINGRGLFKDPINFRLQCKLFMLTNYEPPFDDQYANIERARILPFESTFGDVSDGEKQFKKDPEFVKELMTIYLSEVFSWLVRGAREFYESNHLRMPEELQETFKKMVANSDSIASFFKKRVTITGNTKDYIRKSTLFEAYKTFCNGNSQKCKPRSTLFNRLTDMKISMHTLNGNDVYRGITIAAEPTNDDDDDDDVGVDKSDKSVDISKEYNTLLQKYNELLRNVNGVKPKGFGCVDKDDVEPSKKPKPKPKPQVEESESESDSESEDEEDKKVPIKKVSPKPKPKAKPKAKPKVEESESESEEEEKVPRKKVVPKSKPKPKAKPKPKPKVEESDESESESEDDEPVKKSTKKIKKSIESVVDEMLALI
jgi:P4 family phage/plasmid primase-like protien